MLKIFNVLVQLERPRGNFPGRFTTGFYTVDCGILRMTDEAGNVMRDEMGQAFQAEVTDETHARAVAAVLTPKVRRAALGITETEERFNRKLELPKMSVA